MKTFDHFNPDGEPCPICGKRDGTPAVLIPVDGTEEDGIIQAVQVHVGCLDLRMKRYWEKHQLIYQCIGG